MPNSGAKRLIRFLLYIHTWTSLPTPFVSAQQFSERTILTIIHNQQMHIIGLATVHQFLKKSYVFLIVWRAFTGIYD
jgi:hypothetical protein